MAKENEAISMEIDDKNTDQMNPKFSINVLQLLKSAQMQHGLRHGDYTKSVFYSWAREINKRAITETTVTEVRYLHVLLYTAERAWSHAMENGPVPNGPVPNGLHFLRSCAYASFMKGTLLFELEQNWETALMSFKNAKAVYEQLGKYGDIENQVICRERVQELDPNINYSAQSRLAVMDEARSQQAASMTEFNWLGHRFPVANAKTRVSILKAQKLEVKICMVLQQCLLKKVVMYDKIFAAYHEARSCIRKDLGANLVFVLATTVSQVAALQLVASVGIPTRWVIGKGKIAEFLPNPQPYCLCRLL
ncbi:hypothetical protein MKW92_000419 [Papaver armeniacum]|nr:hypothetical protein MKW92_000419 [Papaver armeniacum]